jgi:hypothetical protein
MKINKHLIYVALTAIIIAVISVMFALNRKKEVIRLNNNLHARSVEYQDLFGRTVVQSYAYEATVRELRQARKTDSIQRTQYEDKLSKADAVIRSMEKKLNQVQSVNTIEVESKKRDTVFIEVKNDSIIIESLKSKHWNIDFTVLNNTIMVADMTYSASIDVVVDRERGKTLSGKKRFILCRILKPKWVYSSSAVCDDPDAKIKTNVFIKFSKN